MQAVIDAKQVLEAGSLIHTILRETAVFQQVSYHLLSVGKACVSLLQESRSIAFVPRIITACSDCLTHNPILIGPQFATRLSTYFGVVTYYSEIRCNFTSILMAVVANSTAMMDGHYIQKCRPGHDIWHSGCEQIPSRLCYIDIVWIDKSCKICHRRGCTVCSR